MARAHTDNPIEFIAVFVERDGQDELRFVAKCCGCGELIHDVTEANFAVVGGTDARPKLVGTHLGARISSLTGAARIFCWKCDGKNDENLPWVNAAFVLRDRDDAAQQHLSPTYRKATRRRVAPRRAA